MRSEEIAPSGRGSGGGGGIAVRRHDCRRGTPGGARHFMLTAAELSMAFGALVANEKPPRKAAAAKIGRPTCEKVF